MTILDVGQRLPCGIMERLVLPLHETLHMRAMVSLVQEGLLFILGFTIDNDGRGEVVRATRRVEARGRSSMEVERRSLLTWKTL